MNRRGSSPDKRSKAKQYSEEEMKAFEQQPHFTNPEH